VITGGVLGLLVVVALLLLGGPPSGGHRLGVVAGGPGPSGGRPARRHGTGARLGTTRRWTRAGMASHDAAPDTGHVITQVSSTLRAGASPATAWHQVGVVCDNEELPTSEGLGQAGVGASQRQAVIAACRLARDVGTPLAPVLDAIADVIGAEVELAGERGSAMAGPRASARVLTWLPVLGLALGAGMGADPVAVLFGGGVGTLAMVSGGTLLWTGRRWTTGLVRTAQRAGAP
jgi:tight adherence protein B